MKKKLFAAVTAASILLSLCACAGQQPDEPTTEQTTGAQESTDAKEIPEDFRWLTYEEYKALSPEEQQAYYESFPSPEEYMVWFNAVAKEHNQSGDGNTQVDGNEGQVTQPTEPAERPQQDPVTPTQKPEKEDPETPTTTTPEKKDPVLLTYEEYLKLSPALQQAYYESFPSNDAYMQWFKAATEEYNDKKNDNSTQVDGNEGQITQPTEQEQPKNPEYGNTTPDEGVMSGLEGTGEAGSGRPQNP